MRPDLLKNIEDSASELRFAQSRVQAAKEEYEKNQVEIARLETLIKAHSFQADQLLNDISEARDKQEEAITRYRFFTADAINHPF